MAPNKRKCVGRVQTKAKKMKKQREHETSLARNKRLAALREKARASRASESEAQREVRLQTMAYRAAESRAAESHQQRAARLHNIAERASVSRAAETVQQHDDRVQHMAERAVASRAAELEQQRAARLKDIAERASTSRAAETVQQHAFRVQEMRFSARQSRTMQHFNLALEAFHYDPRKNYTQHSNVTIGKMESVCTSCRAKKFKGEAPGICCRNGKVKLSQLEPPPQELLSYTSGDTPESKHFLSNIRKYNSCFQMTSFGATSVVGQTGFPSTFTVQGQIYHKAGSLLPLPDQPPKFLQLYFIGNDQVETDQRCSYISGVRRQIVQNLQKMFEEHNDLIKTFKAALDRMPTDEFKVIIRADRRPPGEHERRFNAPQVDEVAVVISGDDCDRRDIVIQRRGESLQRISETHRSYDALQYPVMFPHGEDGYHFNLRQVDPTTGESTNKKISAIDFYAYRLMIRDAIT